MSADVGDNVNQTRKERGNIVSRSSRTQGGQIWDHRADHSYGITENRKGLYLEVEWSEITQLTENPFFPLFLWTYTHNSNTSQFRAGFCKCCLNCHQRSVTAVVQSPFTAAVSVFEQSTVSAVWTVLRGLWLLWYSRPSLLCFRTKHGECCFNCHQRSVTAVVQSPFTALFSSKAR